MKQSLIEKAQELMDDYRSEDFEGQFKDAVIFILSSYANDFYDLLEEILESEKS